MNRILVMLTIDLDNLPSNFPHIVAQEREVVARWKKDGFIEQFYLRPKRDGAVMIFKDKTVGEVQEWLTTLPFYPLRKSLDVVPLIQDVQLS